ncbi:MAG: hypothetical protein KIT14_11815 [bacterium]|nr:hypothetical protein [bacterium]
MSQDDRIKRPRPERTAPIRGWSGLFGRPGGEAGPGGGLDDVVTRSVELGYRVIDEYVRQGQRAAAGLRDRRTDPETLTSDLQGLLGRMAQYTSEFLGVWGEFVELATRGTMPGFAATGGGTPPPASAPAAATAASDEPGVRVELCAARPTEVAVDLRPHTPGTRLCVQGMRAMDPGEPRLEGITLEAAAPGAPLVLRVVVPQEQPAGTYNGIVVEEDTSRPVGTVSVRLPPA